MSADTSIVGSRVINYMRFIILNTKQIFETAAAAAISTLILLNLNGTSVFYGFLTTAAIALTIGFLGAILSFVSDVILARRIQSERPPRQDLTVSAETHAV